MSEIAKHYDTKTSPLSHISQPESVSMPASCFGFLQSLAGPTVIHLKGKKPGCRVVLTLLHGNEPSGLKAVYRLLKEGVKATVDTKIIIVGVQSALLEPVFSYRYPPSGKDINRCFAPPFIGKEGMIAKAIMDCLHQWQPCAVVDIHNTSGSGPAFCVATRYHPSYMALASHFSRCFVQTNIQLGALMEVPLHCPVVTVEVGGAHDADADVRAYEGLKNFISSENTNQYKQDIEVLRYPLRLELEPDTSIAFAERPVFGANVTLRQDIEQMNFGITQPGEVIGWVDHAQLLHFSLCGAEHGEDIKQFFDATDNALTVRRPMKFFMATGQHDIAKQDCLFYFVDASQIWPAANIQG